MKASIMSVTDCVKLLGPLERSAVNPAHRLRVQARVQGLTGPEPIGEIVCVKIQGGARMASSPTVLGTTLDMIAGHLRIGDRQRAYELTQWCQFRVWICADDKAAQAKIKQLVAEQARPAA
jgi:hypothetical protein